MKGNKRFFRLNKGHEIRRIFWGIEETGCARNVCKNSSGARVNISSRCNTKAQLVCHTNPGNTFLFHPVCNLRSEWEGGQ